MNSPESARPHRPLTSFQPCPACLTELERQRAAVGEGGVAISVCGCEPGRGVFAAWMQGALLLRPCGSLQEAQIYEAGLTALLARTQVASEAPGRAGPH